MPSQIEIVKLSHAISDRLGALQSEVTSYWLAGPPAINDKPKQCQHQPYPNVHQLLLVYGREFVRCLSVSGWAWLTNK